jgi:hypothetical protein
VGSLPRDGCGTGYRLAFQSRCTLCWPTFLSKDLRDRWNDETNDIPRAATNPDAFLQVQIKALQREDIEAETLMLFDFFDGVAVCVDSELCDEPNGGEAVSAESCGHTHQSVSIYDGSKGKRIEGIWPRFGEDGACNAFPINAPDIK